MSYYEKAKLIIDFNQISVKPIERCSDKVLELINGDYVIDVHAHLFDIKCINKTYFIKRMVKDFLGLKSGGEIMVDFTDDQLYKNISVYEENWEDTFVNELEKIDQDWINKNSDEKGLIDMIAMRKFLGFKKMRQVYDYYLKKFSLGYHFNLPKEKVLVTALMMDLEVGWNVKIKKTIYDQINELKQLAIDKPILPFLFCDPRRADLEGAEYNLYSLFNYAFTEEQSFFGVKIYPALGYDPSDYRLWPIYEICEKLNIPVLSHCGGETISTDKTTLDVYEGNVLTTITAKNRKEMAYKLNDPKRWELVLQKFKKLRLNIAHFGSAGTWESSSPVNSGKDPQRRKECIIGFMKKYDNVYSDFSYELVDINSTKNLKNVLYFDKIVRDRTLFGTDYWVVNKEGNLHKEQSRFLNIIDDGIEDLELPKKLCLDNSINYLGLKL